MTERAYHHGDLRGALLFAVGEILREQGDANVSLREVARRAKVSHSAPAHHFKNKAGLLTAYATQGYERMGGAALAEVARVRGDGADRLEAVGRSYIRFAIENRAQFELMFRSEALDDDDPRLVDARVGAFSTLRQALEQSAREGYLVDRDPKLVAVGAWAIVHGAASLYLAGRFTESTAVDDPERFAAALCHLYADAVLRRTPSKRRPSRKSGRRDKR